MKLLLLLILLPVVAKSQTYQSDWDHRDTLPGVDTVKVLMLVGDTAHSYSKEFEYRTCEQVGCKDTSQIHKMFDSHFYEHKVDNSNGGMGVTYWMAGYQLLKKIRFGFSDPISYQYVVNYLDNTMQPIRTTIVVWITQRR